MCFEGKLTADKNDKFCIVVARFNEFISSKLLSGAKDAFIRHGAEPQNIDVIWVPGSFEIPLACKKAATKGYSAIVALGAVIKVQLPIMIMFALKFQRVLLYVGLESGVPVIFGVLTTDNIEQAIERAGTKSGNKGADAAESAIEMANLLKNI